MRPPEDSDWRHLLSEAERARMLDDIARVSLAVGRHVFPHRAWEDLDVSLHSFAERRSPVERLAFITYLLPMLTQTVPDVAQSPLTRFQPEPRPVPPLRARRVEPAALLAAVRRGHAERWVEEQAAAWTPDTPENRAVRAFLEALRRDAARIADIAEATDEPAIAEAARAAAGRLRGLSALPLWADVADQAEAWRRPPTHRMLVDGRYALLAAAMRRYRQAFQLDWTHPLFALPSRETWRLYETWTLFQTLDALLTLGFTPQTAENILFPVHQDRLTFALVQGTESRLVLTDAQGQALSLFYNRAFPQGTRSRSHTMQPDITLERPDGALWILDAKFKAYAVPGDEGEDINQMHAYRDAIVKHGGTPAVTRAWCLFCGSGDTPHRSEIAYGPAAASIVGALRLRPGHAPSFASLSQRLAGWLG